MTTIKWIDHYVSLSSPEVRREKIRTTAGKIISRTKSQIKVLTINDPGAWNEQQIISTIERKDIVDEVLRSN